VAGDNLVFVTFVMDDKTPSIEPDAGEIQDVQDYLDARRPVGAEVVVDAPTLTAVAFTLAITPDTSAVRAAAEAELADLLRRDGEPGGTIYHSRVHEALAAAEGETDHTITVPAGDVVMPAGELPILGTVTWV
jgi:uncharacterized phage protein gp47/JayE